MDNLIRKYYNDLAENYDDDRFNNSYGSFIHEQECTLLNRLIPSDSEERVLDLACGTGRLTAFATDGSDFSENMIRIAEKRFPNKFFRVEDAANSGWPNEQFKTVFSFHMFMHLNKEKSKAIFDSIHRIVKKGGTFIFDFPSHKRRALSLRRQKGWHGNNTMTIKEVKELLGPSWEVRTIEGILFLPIHRFPKSLRAKLTRLDTFLCNSLLKEFASYIVIEAVKK